MFKIKTKKGTSSGFLCYIPNPVLITGANIVGYEKIKPGGKISISFGDEEIFKVIIIDSKRKILFIEKSDDGIEINTTIIEIRSDKDKLLGQLFLEFDDNLLKNVLEYKSKNIYLIHYKLGERFVCSTGKINTVRKDLHEIENDSSVEFGSIGCPILLYNNKVIAIQSKIKSNTKFSKVF